MDIHFENAIAYTFCMPFAAPLLAGSLWDRNMLNAWACGLKARLFVYIYNI